MSAKKDLSKPPVPVYWFILERRDEDGGRPYLAEDDLEQWGGIPIPIYDEHSFFPAYEDPTGSYPQDARVTLSFLDITKAVRTASRTIEFHPSLKTITLPQRLGRLFFNVAMLERFEDYIDYNQRLKKGQENTGITAQTTE